MIFSKDCCLRIIIFDQKSPVNIVSESREGGVGWYRTYTYKENVSALSNIQDFIFGRLQCFTLRSVNTMFSFTMS